MHLSHSATHRVMCIPELRSHIFSFSTRKACLSNALVCKGWSNDALNALWHEVEGIGCLVRLLAPLERNQNRKYEFSRGLTPDDWLRFDKYAWRVLILQEPYRVWMRYDSTVFTQLAAARPCLLPNLRILQSSGPSQIISMFLSPRLETFHFTVSPDWLTKDQTKEETVSGVQAVLRIIPIYSPLLQTLLVDFQHTCVAALELALVQSLPSLPALTALHLPSGWLTKQVTHAVASHPWLRAVHSIKPIYSDFANRLRTNVFSSDLNQEDFPSLQQLVLDVSFSRATACLSGRWLPSNLTWLQLFSPTPDSPNGFGCLVEVIGRNCPQLQRLGLSVLGPFMGASEQVDFETIGPLLNCTQLTYLDLQHPNPFLLTSDNVVSIAKALPSLESLNLNNRARQSSLPTLRLSVLLQLARVCPKLIYLGLYVDATDPIEQIPDTRIPIFPRLKVLSVGRSPISNPLSVAKFLIEITLAGVNVNPGPADSPWNEVNQIIREIHPSR